jgi:FKBP-type peptidyl-prolyl cis-trans isomerase (trigger factor)
MSAAQINRLDNGSIEIRLTVPWTDIQTGLEKQTQQAVANAEIPGFRKGFAPRDVVEPKLDKSKLLSQVLGDLLPKTYSLAVTEANLKPLLYPQIRLDKGEDGKDWEFTAITCESPQITLPDYVSAIAKITAPDKNSALQQIIEFLRKNTQIKIPDLLVEEESNHRLADLADNLTHLGLDMQKYLTTKKLTAETLKSQTAQNARVDLEIELILNHIRTDKNLPDRSKTLEFLESLLPKA